MYPLIILLPFLHFLSSAAQTIPCITNNPLVLEDLVACLALHTVPPGHYTLENKKYCQTQPTPTQRDAWAQAVHSLLSSDGDCGQESPPGLEDLYTISRFDERISGGGSYCVLSEKFSDSPSDHIFARGWGYLVVPWNASSISRHIHFSVPHPEQATIRLSTSLFKRLGASSLLISGRDLQAYPYNSPCGANNSPFVDIPCPSQWMYITDPVANPESPFYTAQATIRKWQEREGGPGCPISHCSYLQFQTRSDTQCISADVYFSSGEGLSAPLMDDFYANPLQPARRLKTVLAPFIRARVPGTETASCGTMNVFERLVNGVPESELCTRDSDFPAITGQFLLLRTIRFWMDASWWMRWFNGLAEVFPPVAVSTDSGELEERWDRSREEL